MPKQGHTRLYGAKAVQNDQHEILMINKEYDI